MGGLWGEYICGREEYESYAFSPRIYSILGHDHEMVGLTGLPSAPARIVDITCAQLRLIRGFLSSLRAA